MEERRLDNDVCRDDRRVLCSTIALAEVLDSEESELERDLGGDVWVAMSL